MTNLVGYKYLKTYQISTVIYDLTIRFCNRYISRKSRTHDQMVQAARPARRLRSTSRVRIVPKRRVVSLGGSGKHPIEHFLSPEVYILASQEHVYGPRNIAEGYLEKSLKMYIKLLGVSRGSLGELLEDYADFTRQRGLETWSLEKTRDMREIRAIREKSTPDKPYIPDLPTDLETTVNLLLTLVNQANFLLDRQIAALEEKFIKEGGYSENLFKKRLERKYEK